MGHTAIIRLLHNTLAWKALGSIVGRASSEVVKQILVTKPSNVETVVLNFRVQPVQIFITANSVGDAGSTRPEWISSQVYTG